MYIPKEAFVSNFTMVIKGKTYQANVKTKEVAKQIYEDSTDTSGLLQTTTQPEFTDGKQVHTYIINYLFYANDPIAAKNSKFENKIQCLLIGLIFVKYTVSIKFLFILILIKNFNSVKKKEGLGYGNRGCGVFKGGIQN